MDTKKRVVGTLDFTHEGKHIVSAAVYKGENPYSDAPYDRAVRSLRMLDSKKLPGLYKCVKRYRSFAKLRLETPRLK